MRKPQSPAIAEHLEIRALPAATLAITFADGLLTVSAADPLSISGQAIILGTIDGEVAVTDQLSIYRVATTVKPTPANVTAVLIVGSGGGDYIDPRLIGASFAQLSSPVTVLGGSGNDQIYTSRRDTFIDAGDGDDAIFAEAGYLHNDVLLGGIGRDTIISTDGDDFIDGGNGNDILSAAGGNDTVYGGAGNDRIYAGAGQDLILGQGGADLIYAEDGNDSVIGGTGADSIIGGYGNDTLSGGTENDLIRGGQGDDVIDGGSGDDWLDGDQGSDSLAGSWGDDTLYGDSGYDTLSGGQGTNYRSTLENWDRITDGFFIGVSGTLNVVF